MGVCVWVCMYMYLFAARTLSLSFFFPQLVAISALRDCRRVAEKVSDAYQVLCSRVIMKKKPAEFSPSNTPPT